MDSNKNKIRIVKIIEYLISESDEDHPVSVAMIVDFLNGEGITADRKTIYSDIDAINEHYMMVVCIKKSQNWYYCNDRKFDLAEIQVIVSAIVSAGFIDPKTTLELINKLYDQTSRHIALEIKKNISIKNPLKHNNPDVLNSIYTIIESIRKKKQIKYLYIKHDLDHNEVVIAHKFTAVDLIYNDNYYYAVMAGEKNDNIQFYNIRIDRMRDVEIQEDCQALKHKYNSQEYIKSNFQMWNGNEKNIELEITPDIVDAMYDKFGEGKFKLEHLPNGNAKFFCKAPISQAFFAWVLTFKDKIKILTEDVRNEFVDYLNTVLNIYNN